MVESLVCPTANSRPAAWTETECPTTTAAIAAKQNKRLIRNILSKRSCMVLYCSSRAIEITDNAEVQLENPLFHEIFTG
jgi:hypothetical protein